MSPMNGLLDLRPKTETQSARKSSEAKYRHELKYPVTDLQIRLLQNRLRGKME